MICIDIDLPAFPSGLTCGGVGGQDWLLPPQNLGWSPRSDVVWDSMDRSTDGVNTLIVLAPDQASFYEFVKPRQEAAGRTLVVLDRRAGERRKTDATMRENRRQGNRRARTPEAAVALMSVLGFMILHRQGDQWTP